MIEDEPPGHLRIVSQTDDAERTQAKAAADAARHRGERADAQQHLDWTLRRLAANVLRIVRGAGKPDELLKDINEARAAMVRYENTVGWLDLDQISQAMRFDLEVQLERHREEIEAQQTMVKGALQMAAAQLLGQSTQYSRGQSELSEGRRRFQSVLDAERAQTTPTRKTASRKSGSTRKPTKRMT